MKTEFKSKRSKTSFLVPALLIFGLHVLASCQTIRKTVDTLKPTDNSQPTASLHEFPTFPMANGVRLGALSGLQFEGRDEKSGAWNFLTTTDRGPNLEEITGPNGEIKRPFAHPNFHIQWIRFSFDPSSGQIRFRERTELLKPDGQPFSGLPNGDSTASDEAGVDTKGNALPADPMGIDTESLAIDTDGSVWMGEEYRPSVLHFTPEGRLLSRWVPEGSKKESGTPRLPMHLRNRRPNRGFEGIAVSGASVFAFLQSGLKGEPDTSRIYQIDKETGQTKGVFIYPFEVTPRGWAKVDKIGDAVATPEGDFYVIEQNGSTKEDAFRRIYKIEIQNATDLSKLPDRLVKSTELCERERQTETVERCLLPVRKTLVADLTELGYRELEKAEGLAVVDSSTLAVVNDNDFKLSPTRLLIIHLPKK